MKYVLIGLLKGYRFAISPLYGAGLPLPPVLLGLRPRGGDGPRQPARQLAGRVAGSPAATRGPPAATTPFPPHHRAERARSPSRTQSQGA